MYKNFDEWNIRKKIINNTNTHKLYHEREMWWCSLGTNIGFEQDGTGNYGQRPVLIIKGFSAYACLVIPLTTSSKKNLYHIDIGDVVGRNAFVIISQIRLIDTRRLVYKIGYIPKLTFETIRKSIRDFF